VDSRRATALFVGPVVQRGLPEIKPGAIVFFDLAFGSEFKYMLGLVGCQRVRAGLLIKTIDLCLFEWELIAYYH
jgi:hypothetical protein